MPKAPSPASASASASTVSTAPAAPAPSGLPLPASYEAALEELEQLVGRIDGGQLPLDQLLAGYQRGAELLQFCRERLAAVEEQIKVLDAGVLKPWSPP